MPRWTHNRGLVNPLTSPSSTGPYTKWCRLILWPFSREPAHLFLAGRQWQPDRVKRDSVWWKSKAGLIFLAWFKPVGVEFPMIWLSLTMGGKKLTLARHPRSSKLAYTRQQNSSWPKKQTAKTRLGKKRKTAPCPCRKNPWNDKGEETPYLS